MQVLAYCKSIMFKNNLYIVPQPGGLIFPNCTSLCAFNPAYTKSQLPLKEVTGHTFYFELSQPAVSCVVGNNLNSGVNAGWLDLPVACQGDLVPFLLHTATALPLNTGALQCSTSRQDSPILQVQVSLPRPRRDEPGKSQLHTQETEGPVA